MPKRPEVNPLHPIDRHQLVASEWIVYDDWRGKSAFILLKDGQVFNVVVKFDGFKKSRAITTIGQYSANGDFIPNRQTGDLPF